MTKLKLSLTLLLGAVLMGCEPPSGERATVHPDFNTVVIDSCEYLVNSHSTLSAITHKGNCNNPIHSPQNTK